MICLITARQGSKSITNKNVRLLGGLPLLCWSIKTALDCGLTPVVSSDSKSYLELARRYGAETLLRPAHLAQDDTPHFDVIRHEAVRLDPSLEAIVLFQPTAPFRRKADVLGAIELFEQQDFDSMIAAVRIPEQWHPDTALQLVDGRIQMASGALVKDRIKRRQDHRPAWVPSGGCYILKTKNLRQGNLYGDRVGLYEVEPTVNINNEGDWIRAEEIAKTWVENYQVNSYD